MRAEYPSGLVPGQGVGRSPVRFPAPRRSVRGHFFGNFGMSWDVSVGDVFGWVWEGFEKILGGVENGNFQKWPGVFVLHRAIQK